MITKALAWITSLFFLPVNPEISEAIINENIELLKSNTWFFNTSYFYADVFITDKTVRKIVGNADVHKVLTDKSSLSDFREAIMIAMGEDY